MADLSITAASVVLVSGGSATLTAGATLTPGMSVYTDASGKAQKSLNDTAAHAKASGIVLNSATNGQPVTIATAGAQVTIGATVVAGAPYCVSSNAAGIAPEADFMAGQFVTQIGRAVNATDIVLELKAYGIAHG
jgi:hypothetical protein